MAIAGFIGYSRRGRFGTGGRTVFPAEAQQIGRDKRANPGFLGGAPQTHRERASQGGGQAVHALGEALVRRNHPDPGLVSPAEFNPVAEDIGRIGKLGEWMLDEACAHAAATLPVQPPTARGRFGAPAAEADARHARGRRRRGPLAASRGRRVAYRRHLLRHKRAAEPFPPAARRGYKDLPISPREACNVCRVDAFL